MGCGGEAVSDPTGLLLGRLGEGLVTCKQWKQPLQYLCETAELTRDKSPSPQGMVTPHTVVLLR